MLLCYIGNSTLQYREFILHLLFLLLIFCFCSGFQGLHFFQYLPFSFLLSTNLLLSIVYRPFSVTRAAYGYRPSAQAVRPFPA